MRSKRWSTKLGIASALLAMFAPLCSGALAQTVADLEAQVAKYPNDHESRYKLSVLQMRNGDASEALKSLNLALALAPTNPDYLAMRALAHATVGENELAVKDADQCLALSHDNLVAYIARVRACAGLERWPEAAEGCEKILKMNDKVMPAVFIHAQALEHLNKSSEALDEYTRFISMMAQKNKPSGEEARMMQTAREHIAALDATVNQTPKPSGN